MSVLDNAISLGLAGFFCNARDKRPTCPHGFKDAVRDADRLRDLWRRYPGELVGVPTGAVNGIDVLDVDPRHGGDEWLLEHYDRIPRTRSHKTRSGGLHLLFRSANGLRNSAGKLASGVDVRAAGGYIIWWPATGLAVTNAEIIAPWPARILAILLPRRKEWKAPARIEKNSDPYVAASLRSACNRISNAREGTRNHTLNYEAFAIARFVVSGAINESSAREALAGAAESAGLSKREIDRTIDSAFRARRAA